MVETGRQQMQKTTLSEKIRSVLRWAGWVLLVQVILINISAALYADKLTRYYNNIASNSPVEGSGNIFSKSWKLFTGPKYPRPRVSGIPVFPYDTVTFTTRKGIRIEGWYAAADSAAKGTVIFFHGIQTARTSLLDEVNEFRYLGMNVLMIDFRGHGNSGGRTTTLGIRESEEVKLAFDYVREKGERNIFLYGMSMGAVAVTKALSDYGLDPAGVILDAPFLSLQSYLKGRARVIGFPDQPFAFITCFWIGVEKGFNGFRHKTTRYAGDVRCPVLVQWGSLDNYVLEEEIRAVYDAIPSPDKKLVEYNGADHESFLRYDTEKWRRETEAFLRAYTR